MNFLNMDFVFYFGWIIWFEKFRDLIFIFCYGLFCSFCIVNLNSYWDGIWCDIWCEFEDIKIGKIYLVIMVVVK